MAFEPNANYLLSGSNDMLRAYNWEPVQLLDTVQIGWKNILDMTIHKDQLVYFNEIYLSFHGSFSFLVWSICVTK